MTLKVALKTRPSTLSFLIILRTVYINWKYLFLSFSVSLFFWIFFNMQEQRLFFAPVLGFHIPTAGWNYLLSSLVSILIGISTSIVIFEMKASKRALTRQHSSFPVLSGSIIGVVASICAGCTPSVGLFLVAIFGSGVALLLFIYSSHSIKIYY